ncbi:MAG: hypothetical protein AABZ39_19065 [Spirochaetota bacterium]
MNMNTLWKTNWPETKKRYIDWWAQKGPIVSCYGPANTCPPRDGITPAPDAVSVDEKFTDPSWAAQHRRYTLSQRCFIGDGLPSMVGDNYMHLLSHSLGATPLFEENTTWTTPCIDDPDTHPPLRFSPENRWWRNYEAVARREVEISGGNYYAGLPLFMNDIDALFDLRGEPLMMDFIDRPSWVKEKLCEIDIAYRDAYQRAYDIVKLPDESSICQVLEVWGPGKTALLQSDLSAMISQDMFDEFVVPELSALADWLDHTLYHLDGVDALRHLDTLLTIEGIDAIQWMAGAGQPGNGDKKWYPLYKRILAAGKSVQVRWVKTEELEPLFDAIGTRGVYVMVGNVIDTAMYDDIIRTVEKYSEKTEVMPGTYP